MTVEQQVSSSSGLCRLRMLLSGLSFEPSTNSDSDTPSTNSPALLCSSSDDDDDESNNNDNSMALAMELKADEIQRCLAGTANGDESLVDLWHLRTLSLSTGGLLNSTLRKRSWPKLLGLDETILLNNSAAPSSSVMANSGNIRSLAASTLAIQSALAKIGKSSSPSGATGGLLWDVEGQIKANRRAREAERAAALKSRLGGTAADDDGTTDTASVASNASSIAALYQQQSSNGKKMTKQEMSILTNILTAVFKHNTAFDAKSAGPSTIGQLANLSALLLINLDSPSLTSIMMQSLAKEHLPITEVEEMIDSTFWTLLDCMDEKYGAVLRDVANAGGSNATAFASAWISSWFAAALPTGLGRMDATLTTTANHSNSLASIELEIASRFIDVFLCSHPHMPLYISVVLVMHPINRKIIAEAANPTDALANLPSCMMASILRITDEVFFVDGTSSDGGNITIADERKVELMEVVENIVSDAIDLMRTIPPSKLNNTTKPLPEYMLKFSAPTDFALIKQAKESRSGQITAMDPLLAALSPTSEASTPTASPTNTDSNISKFDFSDQASTFVVPTDEKYSLAVDAVGLGQPARPNVQSLKTWSVSMAVYLAGLAVAVAFDRTIVNIMSDVLESDIASPPVPAVATKISVPASTSNALVPASDVYDIVFGTVFAEEAEIDLDDIADATLPHHLRAIENLIAQALPTTYYYS